jgi:PAS domain S-box-containing protein
VSVRAPEKVNILLVDDQPAKLLSYEVILGELGENLLKANSAREAFEHLLKTDIAVVLVDVVMPELDGFELARMIREHPRFAQIAIIFISAIQLTDLDALRGYEAGAVDYVPVPVVPEILRAKVRVFAELHRKTRQLERLNQELERRVAERTADLEASTARLRETERRRTLALAAGNMGSWERDVLTGEAEWDEGQYRIFGLEPGAALDPDRLSRMVHPADRDRLAAATARSLETGEPYEVEYRILRPSGELRWCLTAAAPTLDQAGRAIRMSGVTHDITERKQAEEKQQLLLNELNHRVKNTLAIVQSIVAQTQRSAGSLEQFEELLVGRIMSLSRTHELLTRQNWESASLAEVVRQTLLPFNVAQVDSERRFDVDGPDVRLTPNAAVTLGMAVHELATNAVKYGAL